MLVPERLRSLIDALADEKLRRQTAQQLAAALGASQLLLYVADPRLGLLLPASGMPKTLVAGPLWRDFLQRCTSETRVAGRVDLGGELAPACALVERGCALILIRPRDGPLPQDLQRAMPLLGAALQAQQALRIGMMEAMQAREAAAKAHQLTAALDAARASAAALNRQLREEHRRKDEFLAMLAHELRNPLAPLTSSIEILRRSMPRDDQRSRRQIEVMTRQVHQLAHLVDDLLDISRVSRGLIELRREVLRLGDVLAAAVEASRPLMETRRHSLQLEAPDPELHVSGDRVRLTQVFSNLLNNAAKYTEPGGTVSVGTTLVGPNARISVRDNGRGIPREMLSSIFDMFTQVPGSLDRAPGGLGIGLTLVRTLLELHGGSVSARSDGPGTGSTFTVLLPTVETPSQRLPAPPEARAAALDVRVLVVDDNVDAAESLAEILRLLGARVAVAHDGAQALGVAAAAGAPDAVLLDIGLPGMDGYETAREWRRRYGGGAQLIALTGYGTAEDKRRTAAAGFDGHLVKPVAADEITSLLARLRTRALRGQDARLLPTIVPAKA